MKSVAPITLVVIAFLCLSCEKAGPPTPDPELGEFEALAPGIIDKSRKNKYNEANFCNHWVLSKVSMETYQDGELSDRSDNVNYSAVQYLIYNDHTFYGSHTGIWLYSHNYLMMKHDGSYYAYEVMSSKKKVLILRFEDFPAGAISKPFFRDNSGTHIFIIGEFHTK